MRIERDYDDSFLLFDLAEFGWCAASAKRSDRRWHGKALGFRGHFDSKTEPLLPRGRLIVRQYQGVIGHHQVDGLPAEQAFAAERAAVEKHLRETGQVVGLRKNSRSSRLGAST